jgi:hypothetical protein
MVQINHNFSGAIFMWIYNAKVLVVLVAKVVVSEHKSLVFVLLAYSSITIGNYHDIVYNF